MSSESAILRLRVKELEKERKELKKQIDFLINGPQEIETIPCPECGEGVLHFSHECHVPVLISDGKAFLSRDVRHWTIYDKSLRANCESCGKEAEAHSRSSEKIAECLKMEVFNSYKEDIPLTEKEIENIVEYLANSIDNATNEEMTAFLMVEFKLGHLKADKVVEKFIKKFSIDAIIKPSKALKFVANELIGKVDV